MIPKKNILKIIIKSAFLLFAVFCLKISKLEAQNFVIGNVPAGMVNVNANVHSYSSPYYIDLDCDGMSDIFCNGDCFFAANNVENLGGQNCDPFIALIDTNVFIYTNAQATLPLFFNMGDTVIGNLSKTINNSPYYYFNNMALPTYICLSKIQPDSSFINYWLQIYTTTGNGFHIYQILKPINHDTIHISRYVCKGSDFKFANGDTLFNIQYDTIQTSSILSVSSCDSTLITHLTMLPPQNTITQNINVCYYKSYTFPDGYKEYYIGSNMTHYSNFISAGGCDSLIVTNIICSPNNITSYNTNVCRGSNYTFPDGNTIHNIQSNISHISHFTDTWGCDSNIQINLKVKELSHQNYTVTVCEGADYTFPDMTVKHNILFDTLYTSHFQNANGCDSSIEIYLSVHKGNYLYVQQKVCYNSDYILLNGNAINNLKHDTAFIISLKNMNGCDSLIVDYKLNVDTIYATKNISVCKKSDFTFPEGYTISNIQTDQSHESFLKTAQGCDSIITTYLTVSSVDTSVSPYLLRLEANATNAGYQWIDCGTGKIIPNEDFKIIYGQADKNYKVVVIGNNGCADTSSCHSFHSFGPEDKGTYVHIYPNPAFFTMNVELYKTFELIDVRLLNTAGQTVLEDNIKNSNLIRMNVSKLPHGIYYLQVKFDFMTENFKVIIQ